MKLRDKRLQSMTIVAAIGIAIGRVAEPLAAQEMRWEPPPESFEIDFGAKDAKTKPVFLKEGMAYQGVLLFPLIKRTKVVVNAKLPGPGEFTAVLDGDDEFIELKQLGPLRYEVVSKRDMPNATAVIEQADQIAFGKLAKQRDEADKEAGKRKVEELENYLRQKQVKAPSGDSAIRSAYVRRRAIELGESTVRAELASLAVKSPQWAPKTEQERWQTLDDLDAYKVLVRLLSMPPACEILRAYGFEIDDKRPGSDRLIESKLVGLSALASPVDRGKDSVAGALRVLTQSDITRIKKALTVRLLCRYRPPTDNEDRNSQWFAAQRVRAGGRGIAAVRLEGSLDNSKHDVCDWWTIADFDPMRYSVTAIDDAEWRYEVTQQDDAVARVRVSLKGVAPCKYALELRPTTPAASGRTVVAREAAPASVNQFPY